MWRHYTRRRSILLETSLRNVRSSEWECSLQFWRPLTKTVPFGGSLTIKHHSPFFLESQAKWHLLPFFQILQYSEPTNTKAEETHSKLCFTCYKNILIPLPKQKWEIFKENNATEIFIKLDKVEQTRQLWRPFPTSPVGNVNIRKFSDQNYHKTRLLWKTYILPDEVLLLNALIQSLYFNWKMYSNFLI